MISDKKVFGDDGDCVCSMARCSKLYQGSRVLRGLGKISLAGNLPPAIRLSKVPQENRDDVEVACVRRTLGEIRDPSGGFDEVRRCLISRL